MKLLIISGFAMNSNKTIESIKSNDLFKDLDFASLNIPFDAKNFLEFKEGDLIYSSNQSAEFIYLLINGEVKIKLNSLKRLFFKSPNEYFGETEVLHKELRGSSAVANSDCLLYQMEESLLSKLINDSSEIRAVLLYNDNNGSNEVHNSNILDEVNKKISEVELIAEPAKIDINQINDFSPTFDTTAVIDTSEAEYFRSEPGLDSYTQDRYIEKDNKSLKSQFLDDPEEMSNWVITEENIDAVLEENKSVADHQTETVTTIENNETLNYSIDNSDSLNQSILTEYQNKNDDPSELAQLANFIMQDVKAPLLTVKHYSSILSRFDLSEEVKKVVALISAQTNSVIDLLQASIDFSEQNIKNKLESLSFNELMNNNLTLLSDYVESRNVKLFKKLGDDANVKIDSRKFYVACYYIARFSCDLMKHGGNLYFSTKVENNSVILIVKDENKVLNNETIKQVFDTNFSHDGITKAGLSLAISKFLIESMHCTLELQSSGSETNYIVSIPVS